MKMKMVRIILFTGQIEAMRMAIPFHCPTARRAPDSPKSWLAASRPRLAQQDKVAHSPLPRRMRHR